MKKRNIVFAIIMTAVLLFAGWGFTTQVYADDMNDTAIADDELDEMDVAIAAFLVLHSDDPKENYWKESDLVEIIKPLYNGSGEVIAWYLKLSSGAHAVVNNNKRNPMVIEFGEADNPLIAETIQKDVDAEIVYRSPFQISDLTEACMDNKKELYELYPELLEENPVLSNTVKSCREKLIADNKELGESKSGNGTFGFIAWGNMQSGTYSSFMLNISGVSWCTTSIGNSAANCGPTCITNLALYYAPKGYYNLKINNSIADTYNAVYAITGWGPTLQVPSYAVTYFSQRGYSLSYSGVSGYSGIKSSISSGKPCTILLADGSWHWVLGVGWREYSTGEKYIQINTGWYDNASYFFTPGSGNTLLGAQAYTIN